MQLLPTAGKLREIPAKHENPLENVRSVIEHVRKLSQNGVARLTIDISSFTRKHFLQLLLGLDLSGMLESCQYLYTEPKDYHTQVDDPISSGITSVRAIDAFAGRLHSSRDTVLILFLGYEGARARALWEHLEPHVTYAVIPDPPMQPSWKGRTEAQNRYILSCLPSENVLKSSALQPADTEEFARISRYRHQESHRHLQLYSRSNGNQAADTRCIPVPAKKSKSCNGHVRQSI